MTAMGLDDELQGRIMDPEFWSVRCTETCVFWALQAVTDRFEVLEFIRERSWEWGRGGMDGRGA